MLNIPETVKALYKQDGVWKNFRAHFPGGELPDITNDDIVEESVKFQESVCSQNVFRFGLTEASVIEFETVGVGNMYGMTMECSSEIDCSSLTAAELADIQAGTWDGELVLPAASGLAVPVFRVPLGTFRVESCPRDHQAMAHRRVTAYTEDMAAANPFEVKKDSLLLYGKTYTPSIKALAMAQVAGTNQQTLLDNGYTKSTVTFNPYPVFPGSPFPSQGAYYEHDFTAKNSGGEDVSVGFRFYAYASARSGANEQGLIDVAGKTSLLVVDYNGQEYDDESDFAAIAAALEENGIDAAQSGYPDMVTLIRQNLPPGFTFKPVIDYGTQAHQTPFETGFAVLQDGVVFYPYRENKWREASSVRPDYVPPPAIPVFIENVYLAIGGGVITGAILPEKTVPTFYRFTPQTEETELLSLSFEPTYKETISISGYGRRQLSSYSDAFRPAEIVQGALELWGAFATAARGGGGRVIRLSETSPEAIIPGQYQQMWFDEFAVEPIGTIRYAYTDEADEEQIVDYVIGSGASVYDMSDNAALKAMTGATPEVIESILDTSFVPHLGPVNFVPIDLAAKGLPYLEAGDALAVTAQDGTVCISYALRRELGGVQALTDQIDSESGLIIDSEEGA